VGYTHYWRTKPGELDATTFAAFRLDAERIFAEATRQGLALGDAHGKNEPEVGDDFVAFNGVGERSHETCRVTRVNELDPHLRRNEAFGFTKTAYKPYDRAVTAVLLAYRHRFPGEVRLSSDGDHDDWLEGQALVKAACGYVPEITFA